MLYRYLCLVWLCSLALLPAHAQSTLPFRVGTAVANITPCSQNLKKAGLCGPDYIELTSPEVTTNSGYQQHNASTIESDLQARVLLLQDAQAAQVAIVTLDLLSLPDGFTADVRSRVQARPGLGSLQVLLSATHTHGGPVLVGFGGASPDLEYLEKLKAKLVITIEQAVQQAVPATLRMTTGQSRIATYRRGDGKIPIQRLAYEQRLDVLQARDAQGNLLAVAYTTGCHPVSLMANTTCFTSDFPGKSREVVEAALSPASPGVKAFFLQGFAGDLNPFGPGQSFTSDKPEFKNTIGTALGQEVLSTLGSTATSWDLTGALALQQRQLALPLQPGGPGPSTMATEVDALTVGVTNTASRWTFLFSSHEVVGEYAASVRSNFSSPEAVTLIGYANSQFGYLPTRRMIDADGETCQGYPFAYEGCSSFDSYGLAHPAWHDDDYYANQDLLSDHFTGPSRDPSKWVARTFLRTNNVLWHHSEAPVPASQENDRLRIAPLDGQSGLHYGGFASVSTYDFRNRAASVELVQPPANIAGEEFFLAAARDGNNYVGFNYHDGQLWAYQVQNGTMGYSTLAPYNASAHRFLRLRSDATAGLIYWEVSATGDTWTTLTSLAPSFALTAVRFELVAGTYNPTSGATPVILDNFDLTVPGVQTLDTFFDDFNAPAVAANKWNVGTVITTSGIPLYDGNVAVSQAGQHLTITPISAPGLHYNGLSSAALYNLNNHAVSVEVVQAPTVTQSGEEFFLFTALNNANYYAFNIHDGQLFAYTTLNGNMGYEPIGNVGPAAHLLRLRGSLGYIFWEVSADGSEWQILKRVPAAFSLASLHIELVGGTYGANSTPVPIILDNFNLPPTNGLDPATLTDDFNASAIDMGKWRVKTTAASGQPLYSSQVAVAQSAQQLAISTVYSPAFAYNGLSSTAVYDLTKNPVSVEVVQAPAATDSKSEVYLLAVQNSANYYIFNIYGGRLNSCIVVDNQRQDFHDIGPFNTATRFLRLRYDVSSAQPRLLWESSFDGTNWSQLDSRIPTVPLTSVRLEVMGGTFGETAPSTIRLDNFNLLPSSTGTNRNAALATQPVKSQAAFGLAAYPNPASSALQLEVTSAATAVSVELKTLLGQSVRSLKLLGNSKSALTTGSLPVQDLASGIYLLVVSDSQGNSRTAKVSIQH